MEIPKVKFTQTVREIRQDYGDAAADTIAAARRRVINKRILAANDGQEPSDARPDYGLRAAVRIMWRRARRNSPEGVRQRMAEIFVDPDEMLVEGCRDLEDLEAFERINEGVRAPGLSLHELRHVVALLDMGWTENCHSELRSLLKQVEAQLAQRSEHVC